MYLFGSVSSIIMLVSASVFVVNGLYVVVISAYKSLLGHSLTMSGLVNPVFWLALSVVFGVSGYVFFRIGDFVNDSLKRSSASIFGGDG
jgi:hypothetical protein